MDSGSRIIPLNLQHLQWDAVRGQLCLAALVMHGISRNRKEKGLQASGTALFIGINQKRIRVTKVTNVTARPLFGSLELVYNTLKRT